MLTLVIITLASLAFSFLCSVMEAALLTVPYAHAKHVADSGSWAGKRLLEFKDDIRQPIAAILLLNTISHTVGSAVGGALVAETFHRDSAVVAFSIVFTLALLYLAEIPPKELGVVYCRKVSLWIVFPLVVLIKLFTPFIRMSEWLARSVGGDNSQPSVSLAEVISVATIGSEEGVLDRLEGVVIRNIIDLDKKLVKDIHTPRVVVFRLSESQPIEELRDDILTWTHTRTPIYPEDEPDRVERYVLQRDVFRALIRKQTDVKLRDLARPLTTVSNLMPVDKLLLQMLEKREHICSVVDEHGGFAGIVSLEDVLEEIVGREIVDESDLVSDLRLYARSVSAKKRPTKS